MKNEKNLYFNDYCNSKNQYVICSAWIEEYFGKIDKKKKYKLTIQRNDKDPFVIFSSFDHMGIYDSVVWELAENSSITGPTYLTLGKMVKKLRKNNEDRLGANLYLEEI